MEAPLSHPPIPPQGRPPPRNRQRRPPGPTVEGGSEHDPSDSSAGPSRQTNNPRRNHRPRPPRSADQGETNEAPSRQTEGGAQRDGNRTRGSGGRGRGRGSQPRASSTHQGSRPRPAGDVDRVTSSDASTHIAGGGSSAIPPRRPQGRRAAKFNPNISSEPTDASPNRQTSEEKKPSERYRHTLPQGDDLTSTLIRSLSTPPYPDCLICFASIHPAQPTWSCSPLIPITTASEDEKDTAAEKGEADSAQCCWNTFHLKCIRSWASKSVKDVADAWRARGEDRQGVWRCPGCQSKRAVVPGGYWCYCGSTPDPKRSHIATPHSCGGPCTRPRTCGHQCSIACHPGPCPPCQVTTQLRCFCGGQVLSVKCSHLSPKRPGSTAHTSPSCGQTCGKKLSCGNHSCQEICHNGECKPCAVTNVAKCYCGKHSKELSCGDGEEKVSETVDHHGLRSSWKGRFPCEDLCDRPFACGTHRCKKPCHPQVPEPSSCPNDPSRISHCPCGKHPLDPASVPFFAPGAKLVRTSCTDPIPTCQSTCMKPLEGCSHTCPVKCHIGPCPPCSHMVVRHCRCGSTTREIRCHEDQANALAKARGMTGNEILCKKACGVSRNCGRHECKRICCPLASLASNTKNKGKKKIITIDVPGVVDPEGWHECDLVCGKLLRCGNHICEERDHRGVCPPCLRSSFEEMICYCRRTVLEPPIPCGTRINCTYPCSRPPLSCGHPRIPHACHENPNCPPCVVLTSKPCICGKKLVNNVRCSSERVTCGQVCGKLLACGFHHCERTCHGEECGPCHAVCGKPRKLCLPAKHPCPLPCHAPSACSETELCHESIIITCPCGRIRQSIPCGRSSSNPSGREGSQQLKCTPECAVAKRNARLAEALGINADTRNDGRQQISYRDDVIAFAKGDPKFCALVEKAFADFVSSDKRVQVLPHMPENRRKFVHDLAAVYRMDTQMVDQEPYRSVQLFRRVDTRIPTPLLSSTISTNQALGKLTDLRAPLGQPTSQSLPSRSQTSTPVSAMSSGSRGWTSVVARQQQPSPKPETNPTAWLTSNTTIRGSSAPLAAPVASQVQRPIQVTPQSGPSEDVPDDWEDDA